MSIQFEDVRKAKQLRQYFSEKKRIYIVVDATSDTIEIPDHLRGDPSLRLVLNSRMPQPIFIRDSFVESNFSFSGRGYHCVIPMNCIWAAHVPEEDISRGLMWERDMPETIRMMLDAVLEVATDENLDKIKLQPAQALVEGKMADGKTGEGRKIRHLRVVK